MHRRWAGRGAIILMAAAGFLQADVTTFTAAGTKELSANDGWDIFGSTKSSYGLDRKVLYAIDMNAAAPSSSDNDQTNLSAAPESIGVSTTSDSLYFMDGGTLYQLNTATGQATVVGPSMGGIGNGGLADWRSDTRNIAASAASNMLTPSILTINMTPNSAAPDSVQPNTTSLDPPMPATLSIVSMANPEVGANLTISASSLADDPPDPSAVPEPRPLILLGAVFAGIVGLAARRDKIRRT